MTQLKRQVIAVLAAGSLFVTTPVFAASTLTITGNGSDSDNSIHMETSTDTSVVQSNVAQVTNNVTSNSTTGGNKANDNTGGDVMIRTGDAASTTKIQNTLNSNMAKVDCGCNTGDVNVTITGNGTDSDNHVSLDQGGHQGQSTQVFQDNKANVLNNVDTNSSTGKNEAKATTGGDVTIRTGDATATNDVKTTANANVATVGGQSGEGQNGGLSAIITGNGSDTDNHIHLELSHDTSIVQDNLANVVNNVDANAKTGYNKANDNTQGEVAILTGDATAKTTVDNMVNFNAADVDCGCLLDTTAKVGGNGTDSDNTISAELGNDINVFQGGNEGKGNNADLLNNANADAKTGVNNALDNTGAVTGSDPFVWTGDAATTTTVSNVGNSNVYGGDWATHMPQFDFNFNMAQLANFFGM